MVKGLVKCAYLHIYTPFNKNLDTTDVPSNRQAKAPDMVD